MDLFEYAKSKTLDRESPLASRLRPTSLEEVVGQEHIVGKDKLLYRAIKADKLTSVIFYGPPGTGKTTLAKVIDEPTSSPTILVIFPIFPIDIVTSGLVSLCDISIVVFSN